jgi:hypothetical protein
MSASVGLSRSLAEITLDALLAKLTADCEYSSAAHHPYRWHLQGALRRS